MTYRLTERAERDLEDILGFLATRDGEARATAILEEFASAFDRLATSPQLGRVRTHLTGPHLRWWTVHRWLIVYDPVPTVTILRIVHGARSIDRAITGWFGRLDDE